MVETPQVQDKAPKPEGLLPKNVQSWLLAGLAFLMVAIMWLTGGKKPQPARSTPSAAPAAAPLEVNETKIAELQNRIEELQRQQLVAQSALGPANSLAGRRARCAALAASGCELLRARSRMKIPFKPSARGVRMCLCSASNVALSYRKTPPLAAPAAEPEPAPSPVTAPGETTQTARLLEGDASESRFSCAQVGRPRPQETIPRKNQANERRKRKTLPPFRLAPPMRRQEKPTCSLKEPFWKLVLINRLDGGFAGPVECLLSSDVYSNDRQHLLIPAGSKLLGETKKVDTFGQSRLAVVFHRVLMPDGYSVNLDQFKGLNQIGDTGLRDQVNNHYLRIFGVSLAIGAIGAVAEGGTTGSLNASGSDLMRQGFAQGTAQSSAQILDKFLNIMPTVTIREGHRVKVYLSGDLALPDYHNHKMPSDL